MMAMFHGVFCPPRMAALAVADRFIVRTPISPPNHRFTFAVCVTVSPLACPRPVEPFEVMHGTLRLFATVEKQVKVGVANVGIRQHRVRIQLSRLRRCRVVTFVAACVWLGIACAPASAAALVDACSKS